MGDMPAMDFDTYVRDATNGFAPYPYQRRLAEEGLPELLRVPTGAGKSVAAVLPWLWRRRHHPDPAVRQGTPHWLVVALPLRTLVDQFETVVGAWLTNLELTDTVGLHVLLGGRKDHDSWTSAPAQDAIFLGSIDMLLSRALNRGYAAGRYHWPLDFGMLNNGTQWVFDEVQLLGPALPTSRQLQSLRDGFGTALPSRSMWMSATVDPSWLTTVDAPEVGNIVELAQDDVQGSLRDRVEATRTVSHLAEADGGSPERVAALVASNHRAGTRTILIVNTVGRAQQVFLELQQHTGANSALVHSRLRPPDRMRATVAATGDVPPAGLIVVSTQALEAGIDMTLETLVTEVAPWSSIVQRAGRCNRDGRARDARLLWFDPPDVAPYDAEVLARSHTRLIELEAHAVTGGDLAAAMFEPRPFQPVLRRRDILELFDTSTDLSGNVVDVSMYIRDTDDRDVFVGWRAVDGAPNQDIRLKPGELVRAPVGDMRRWLRGRAKGAVWAFDHLESKWITARPDDVRPGQSLLADVAAGGYDSTLGWSSRVRGPVPALDVDIGAENVLEAATDEGSGEDPVTFIGQWVTLIGHLRDTEREATVLLRLLGLDEGDDRWRAAARAARLHDLGKAHPVFQRTLHNSAGDDEDLPTELVWAKSSRNRPARHERRHFRHELVTLLALRSASGTALLDREPSLVRYLAAAHHGRVRLGVRALPDEHVPGDGPDALVVLGVVDGEPLPPVDLGDGQQLEATTLNVASAAALGGEGSWTREALELRDRHDLGPFRLGFLEALVRLADWAASGRPSRVYDAAMDRWQEVDT